MNLKLNNWLVIFAGGLLIVSIIFFFILDSKKNIKVNEILYTNAKVDSLPEEWKLSREIFRNEEPKFNEEIVTIKNGEYSIEISKYFTGIDNCGFMLKNSEKEITKMLKRLDNNYLGKVVYRDQPNKGNLKNNQSYVMRVCSSYQDFNYYSQFGMISYKIPLNFNQKILDQMDKIVESITPLN